MQEAISVSFRWTAQEMVNLQRLYMRYSKKGRKLRRIYFLAMVVLPICAIGMFLRFHAFNLALPFLLILVVLFLMPLFMRRAALKAYAKRPDKDMVVTYEITDERLIQRNEISTSEMLWRTIIRAHRVPEGFLLYVSDRSVHWLPVHGFEDPADVDRLAQIAKKNVADYESSV